LNDALDEELAVFSKACGCQFVLDDFGLVLDAGLYGLTQFGQYALRNGQVL
jgi:hypothetical protein